MLHLSLATADLFWIGLTAISSLHHACKMKTAHSWESLAETELLITQDIGLVTLAWKEYNVHLYEVPVKWNLVHWRNFSPTSKFYIILLFLNDFPHLVKTLFHVYSNVPSIKLQKTLEIKQKGWKTGSCWQMT